MNLHYLLAIVLSVLLTGCATTQTTQSTEATTLGANEAAAVDSDDDDKIDWLEAATNAADMNEFAVALNNLIYQGENDSMLSFLLLTRHSMELLLVDDIQDRPKSTRPKRLVQFTRELGSVCLPADESDWDLTRFVISQDMQSATLDYHINFNGSISWCTLQLEQVANKFKIVNLTNQLYNIDLAQYMHGFAIIDSNPEVSFAQIRRKGSEFYGSIKNGYDAFDAYANKVNLNKRDPLIRMIQLSLLEAELEYSDDRSFNLYIERLESFVSLGGDSEDLPIQQLYLNAVNGSDVDNFQQNLNYAEIKIGDVSGIRSNVASLLLDYDKVDLARDILQHALKSDPVNEDLYFEMFRVHLHADELDQAVLVLRILEERFDYEFSRKDFNNNESYAAMVTTESFEQWLPKKELSKN